MSFTTTIKYLLQTSFVVTALLYCCPVTTNAQVLYGTLLGTVTDASGGAVANASVTATPESGGQDRTGRSDENGLYRLPDLAPGAYRLHVERTGFANQDYAGVSVSANTQTRLDMSLNVNSQQQTVDVSSSAERLQTDSGVLQSEISAKAIQNIPLSGYRNYQTLLNLVPGATPARFQNSVLDTPARSLTTNVNGTQRASNLTSVDGAAIQMPYLPHHTIYNPPVEAIETVNVVTNSFNAEQGFAGGAAVTVITKSGTNNFHGALFEDNTTSALAARNFFYLRQNVPKNILNQFGAAIGGPILRDKLFFFSDYEGLLQRQTFSNIFTVPTAAQRQGNFAGLSTIYDPSTGAANGSGRTAFLNNQIDPTRFNPAALKMLTLVPLPNLAGNSNNYFSSGPLSLDRHSIDEKVTWQVNERSSMFGKYSMMQSSISAVPSLGAGGGTGLSANTGSNGSGNSDVRAQVAGVGVTHTFSPNMLVDGNFGYGRNDVTWYGTNYGKNLGTDLLGIPGTNGTDPRSSGLPSFAIDGYETFGDADTFVPEIRRDNVFTYVANLNWTHGPHTFRFGFASTNTRLNQYQPQRGFGPRGGFTFSTGVTALNGGASPTSANAFAAYLLGQASSLGKSYQYLDPITVLEWQHGIYAQDQWQLTRRLTLNLGVRWEYYPIVTRESRGLERYDLATNQVFLGGVGSVPSNGGTKANPHQFGPRAGFAYRASDRFVIRGGYGISYDPYPFSRAMRDPYPVTIAQIISPTSSYLAAGNLTAGIPAVAPVNFGNGIIPLPKDAYTKTLLPGEYARGYAESFNFTVESRLPADLVLTTSFVRTLSIRQIAYVEANAGQVPGLGAAGQPLFQPFGRVAQTQVIQPFHTANYNALQVNVKRRFARGFLVNSSYTYSKSLDYNTDADSSPLFNALAYQSRDRAVSDFDRTHVFQTGFVYELPMGKGKPFLSQGISAAVLGGWQINGILALVSGLPFTVTASATSLNAPFNTQVADLLRPQVNYPQGIGVNATWFDTSAFAPVSQARFGTGGRNQLRGPGNANFDFGLQRNFAVGERLRMELRGEAFNLTNTPNFANPSGNISSGTFGRITQTISGPSDSRNIRIALRVSF